MNGSSFGFVDTYPLSTTRLLCKNIKFIHLNYNNLFNNLLPLNLFLTSFHRWKHLSCVFLRSLDVCELALCST